MTKYFILLLTIQIGFNSCLNESKIQGFKINGTIENAIDSTIIYLDSESEVIDSAFVINGVFEFTGNVQEPEKFSLYIKDSRDLAALWIENGVIEFKAKKNNFLDRNISGSEAQEFANILHSNTLILQKQMEELYLVTIDAKDENVRKETVGKISDLFNQLDRINKEFAHQNPNCYETLSLLNTYNNYWGKKEVSSIFSKVNSEFKNTTLGKSIDQFIHLSLKPEIGDKYVDFTLMNISAEEVSLSNLKSDYTLVVFWASWCIPCRKKHPELLKLYSKYKSKGFNIVSVALDDNKGKWKNAVKKDKLLWSNLNDLNAFEGEVSSIYEIEAVPYNFIINNDGVILADNISVKELNKMLERIFE